MVLKPIYNAFGGIDEQAMTDQFEDFVGGVSKAQRLWNLWKMFKYYPIQKYINRAKAEGFSEDQALSLFDL